MMAHWVVTPRASAAALLISLLCGLLAGCASPQAGFNPEKKTSPFRDPSLSIQSAKKAITVGTSNRSELLATLGPATVIQFDSGFEVWVYRESPPATANSPAELVILLSPEGLVKKTRVRPPYSKAAP